MYPQATSMTCFPKFSKQHVNKFCNSIHHLCTKKYAKQNLQGFSFLIILLHSFNFLYVAKQYYETKKNFFVQKRLLTSIIGLKMYSLQ